MDLAFGFGASPISAGDKTQLTMTLTDAGVLEAGRRVPEVFSGVNFSVTLPSTLVVAAGTVTGACASSVTAGVGTAGIAVVGATSASGPCVISVPVTSAAAGGFTLSSTSVGMNDFGSIGAASLTVIAAPVLSLVFSGSTRSVDATTNMVLTLTRMTVTADSAPIAYTLALPTNLVVAGTQTTGSCGGTPTGGTDATTIALTGAVMTADASTCTVTVPVKSHVVGTYLISTDNFSGVTGVTLGTLGSLAVFAGPNITVSFNPTTFVAGSTSTLTLQVGELDEQSRQEQALTAPVAFTLTLPSGLVVAPTPAWTNTCGGTASATDTSKVVLAGTPLVVFGTCTVTVRVTSNTAGVYSITGGSFSAVVGLTLSVVTRSVTVTAVPSALTAAFSPTSIAVGGTSYLTITITRPAGPLASGMGFSVPLPAGLAVGPAAPTNTCTTGTPNAVVGSTTVAMTGLGLAADSTGCVFTVPVTPSTTGAKTITGESITVSGSLLKNVDSLTLTVTQISQTISFAAPGDMSISAGTLQISATASSTLAVTFTSATEAVCTVSGTTVTLHAAGSCTINADQAGNASYTAAPRVSHTFTVTAVGAAAAVTATGGVSSITATWNPPADTSGITGYTAVAAPGPATCTTTGALTCVMGGTAGVKYTITVIAHSAGGDSAASDPSNEATPTAPPTPATPPDTTLTLTTDKGKITTAVPGQEIVFIGTGFAPYSTVVITVYSAPTVLGTAVTDGNGNFSKPITVPPGLVVGAHTIVAQGVAPNGTPRAMKLAVTVAKRRSSGSGLAVTGNNIAGLTSTGIALLTVGAVLVGTARRRRIRPHDSAVT